MSYLPMIHARRQRVPRRVALFRAQAQASAVRLLRQDVGGEETYWLERMIGGGRFHSQALHNDVAGANQFFQLFESAVKLLVASFPADDEGDGTSPGVQYSGTGWYHSIKAQAYNGAYETSGTAPGEFAEWVTPAGTTSVGLRWVQTTGRGFALVEIDGDPARATELPTAAELIALGTLDASALISSGGTLEPTDRLLDQYGAATHYDQQTLFARDLPPGIHTIRVAVTGYSNPAATGTRIGLSAFLHGGSLTGFDAPGLLTYDEGLTITTPATYEFATMLRSTVAEPTSKWAGGSHGNERMATGDGTSPPLEIEADGQAVALENGGQACASMIVITRETELLHPDVDAGGTGVVAVRTTYTLSPKGLHLRMQLVPLVAVRYGTTYACMLSVPNGLAKCSNAGLEADYPCDKNDGSTVASAKSDQLWAWEPNGEGTSPGHVAAMVWIPDVRRSMNDYAASAKGLWLSDRTADNKIYPTRRDGGYEDAPVGAELDLDGWFIWSWFPDADAALSRQG